MERPRRILFTGTFSSGKTTLLNELRKNFAFVVVPEVARDLLMTDPNLERQPIFQDMLFEEQIKREQNAENDAIPLGSKAIICDRGILDIIAYAEVLGHEVKPEWITSLYQRYSIVLIFDKSDVQEINLESTKYRDLIDSKIRETVQRFRLPYYEISGIHDKRLREVESIICEHLMQFETEKKGKEM